MFSEAIKRLREQAGFCRRFADQQTTRLLRDEFLRRADEIDKQAEKLERAAGRREFDGDV